MKTKTKGGDGAVLAAPVTVGAVTVRPWKPGKVMLDFTLPNGMRPRPIVAATTSAAAQNMASQIATAIEAQRLGIASDDPMTMVLKFQGKQTGPAHTKSITISEAIAEAIERGSHARPYVKRDYRRKANQFVRWFAATHPALSNRWESVRFDVLQEYANSLAKLSHSARHVRWVPISLTARYWAARDPELYRNHCVLVRFPEGRRQEVGAVLPAASVEPFFAALRELQPSLYPLAALTVLAGLRVTEAASLRFCDVDLVAGTVTVTDTGTHVPKNHSSWRTIALSKMAHRALREIMQPIQPIDRSAPLFLTARGCDLNFHNINVSWTRFLKYLNRLEGGVHKTPAGSFSRLPGWSLRGGRRTFATIALKGDADRELLKRYLGHTAGDMLGEHYQKTDLADMKKVAAAFDLGFVNQLSTVAEPISEAV